MKKMKWLSICLAALLVLTPCMGVAAADGAAFVVDEVSGNPGDTVTVNVSVQNNPGIIALGLKIHYDTSVLELTNAKEGVFKGASFGPLTNEPFSVIWVDAVHPNNKSNGAVAVLTFKIKDTASNGKSAITLFYDQADVFSLGANGRDFVDAVFATVAGGVTVGGGTGSGTVDTDKVLHSVTESENADRGLGFLFSIPAKGVKMTNRFAADVSGATVSYQGTDCRLVRMGALMTANAAIGGSADAMVLSAAGVTDVPVTTLWGVAGNACSYAVRMKNIPASAVGRTVYARYYYVVEYQGAEVVVYGNIDATTYQANR